MLTTQSNLATERGGSRRLVLLAVLLVLVLLAALAPASAMAGGGDSGGTCDATVTTTQSMSTASFGVDCGDGNNIASVTLRTNEENEGSVEGDDNTDCTEQSNREFECSPTDPDSSIGGRFEIDGNDDVCADPRLEVSFTVDLEDGTTEEINNVEVSGCSDSTSGGDEDSGATPEGGVDSGAGGTANPAASPGAALPIAGATLLVVALASAGLLVRRTRTNS